MVYRQVVLTTQSKGDGRFGFGFCAEDTRYLYSQLKKRGQSEILIGFDTGTNALSGSTVKKVTKTFPTSCRHFTNKDTTKWIEEYGRGIYEGTILEEDGEIRFIISLKEKI